jgi:hypothetical protein
MQRERYDDRNLHKGGRSFYFFDFDDNVMSLPTPIYVFHRDTGEEVALSTGDFARFAPAFGQPGPWADYRVDPDDVTGSFRRFRDVPGRDPAAQPFVEEIARAVAASEFVWKGPSWPLFEHAVHNHRPLSIITARGHRPETLVEGIGLLERAGHLSRRPNYLSLYPVSHPGVRTDLGDAEARQSIAELKLAAIHQCVEAAMRLYGENPHHRFGMSEDSPENLDLVTTAMHQLKARYPDNAFFVIDASGDPVIKTEVLRVGTGDSEEVSDIEQLDLFARVLPGSGHR